MSAFSKKTNRFRPEVQALEERQLLTVSLSFSAGVLRLEGGSGRDFISLANNGNGVVTVEATGIAKHDEVGVNRLEISTKGGNDTVFITQTGNLVRDFTADVRLGDGADVFSMSLLNDIIAFRTMRLRVRGEDEADRITVAPDADVDIQLGARLLLNLEGGSNNDRVSVFYRGELDGTLDVNMSGGAGDDTLKALLGLDAGSRGRVGNGTSRMEGDTGSDLLTFLVSDFSEATVSAEMDGGRGFFLAKDRGTHTTNVRASTLEQNDVVNFQ
jgi:hypothetical protein